jgi:hypothetical protein
VLQLEKVGDATRASRERGENSVANNDDGNIEGSFRPESWREASSYAAVYTDCLLSAIKVCYYKTWIRLWWDVFMSVNNWITKAYLLNLFYVCKGFVWAFSKTWEILITSTYISFPSVICYEIVEVS